MATKIGDDLSVDLDRSKNTTRHDNIVVKLTCRSIRAVEYLYYSDPFYINDNLKLKKINISPMSIIYEDNMMDTFYWNGHRQLRKGGFNAE